MKYLIFDTETTGMSSAENGNDIIQIGGIFLQGRTKLGDFDYSCKPTNWNKISQTALDVNRITRVMLESFDPPESIFQTLYKEIHAYSCGEKFVLVGQNIPFDRRFFKAWWTLWVQPGQLSFDDMFYSVDMDMDLLVVTKAMQRANIINPPNRKLGTIATLMGITPNGALHNAYVDADVTMRTLFACIDYLNKIRVVEPVAIASLGIDRYLDM